MKYLMSLHMAILALLFGMVAATNDLVFFPAAHSEHCSTEDVKDYVSCLGHRERVCCKSADPFCARGALLHSDGWTHTIYLSTSDGCRILDDAYDYERCTTSSGCCIVTPMKSTPDCSMYWHFGEPSHDPNHPTRKALLETREEEPCHHPDVLTYTAEDGTQRKIGIPDGEFEEVMRMYTKKDLKALGRYETLQEDGE